MGGLEGQRERHGVRSFDDAQLEKLGALCVTLLSEAPSWLHRRKEVVTFLDESAIRRHESVDFSIDDAPVGRGFRETCEAVLGTGICAVPLFVLGKRAPRLLAFDLTDEDGRSLPLLTRGENGAVSAAALKSLADKKLREAEYDGLPDTLATKLEALACGTAGEGIQWLRRLENPLPDDPDKDELAALLPPLPPEVLDDESEEEVNWNDPEQEMRYWLTTLADASIVLTIFESKPIRRRIVKLSYDAPMNGTPKPLSRLAWKSFSTWTLSAFIMSERYHFEVKAPPGLRLTQVGLADDTSNPGVAYAGFRRSAHLYLDDASKSRTALASFGLRVSGRGVIGGLFAAALLVLVAQLGCIYFSRGIAENSSGVAALLLVFPGLIATYVARPDDHGLITRLLAVPRWLLLLAAGFSAYYSAGRIALAGATPDSETALVERADQIAGWLWPPAAVTMVAVVVLAVAWLCTRDISHRLYWLAVAAWRTSRRTQFWLHEEIPIRDSIVFEHAIGKREPCLVPERGRRKATVKESNERDDLEYVIGCYAGLIHWTHGFAVEPGPRGSTLRWIFRVRGRYLPRWVVAGFVYRERRRAKRALADLRAGAPE